MGAPRGNCNACKHGRRGRISNKSVYAVFSKGKQITRAMTHSASKRYIAFQNEMKRKMPDWSHTTKGFRVKRAKSMY